MKKVIVLVAAMLMAITCSLFVACGGGIEGTYKVKSVKINGTVYEIGDEVPELGELKEDTFKIEIKADKTFSFTEKVPGQAGDMEYTFNGTWEVKEGEADVYVAHIDDDGDSWDFEVTIKDGQMTFDMNGVEVTLKK